MPGKGRLTLTGKLGDVMQESAQAAMSYVRSKAEEFGIRKDFHRRTDVHVHVPEGSIPKDGPSAGITLATALVSNLASVPTRRDVAMTGEITLRGKVLPIGGVKEKVLAAHRAGVKTIILPKDNEKDLADIPKPVLDVLELHLVESMDEVLKIALAEPLVLAALGRGGRRVGDHRRRRRDALGNLHRRTAWIPGDVGRAPGGAESDDWRAGGPADSAGSRASRPSAFSGRPLGNLGGASFAAAAGSFSATAERPAAAPRRMKIHTAEFVRSVGADSPLPDPRLPQVSLIGRSNVGKSTLINALRAPQDRAGRRRPRHHAPPQRLPHRPRPRRRGELLHHRPPRLRLRPRRGGEHAGLRPAHRALLPP